MFDRFVAIDWSGARGERLPGIAVAVAEAGETPPRLVPPPHNRGWSREDVENLIVELGGAGRTLIGADFSFSLPFLDKGRYFRAGPACARDVWRLVDEVSADDAHLYARRFVEDDRFVPLFRRPGLAGDGFSPRLRVTEAHCRAAGFGPAESVYNLVGAAQVGLGSLSGMRMLNRLDSRTGLAVWPFKAPEKGQSCLVEMYTRLFLKRAGVSGGKVRTPGVLDAALLALGSGPYEGEGASRLSDHETDVLVSAAGLRDLVATGDLIVWNPPDLSDKVRLTEGWTFGVV